MMFSRLKRKTTLFLAVVFIYNTFGFLLLQPLLTNYFEHLGLHKAANPSEEDKVEIIVLNKEDIRLKKINFEKMDFEEFRLDDKYFDIVKEEERDSFIYFYCISDERENALEKEFQERVDENSSNKKQKPENINPFKNLTIEPVHYTDPNQMVTGNQKYHGYNFGISIQNWGDVPTPPPKSLLSA